MKARLDYIDAHVGSTPESVFLILRLPSSQKVLATEAIKKADKNKQKWLTIESKRSLNANAYLWVILDKIAAVVGNTKENLYRKFVRDAGLFEMVTIRSDAAVEFSQKWASKGLGWQSEVFEDGDTQTTLVLYYGSSVYSKSEMSKLIEDVVYEAKELGIETMTPEELASLMSSWRGDNG